MSETRLLTADELAEQLGVSKRLVMGWLADGRIPAAVREGHTLRFDPDKVRTALAKRAAKRTATPPKESVPHDFMVPTY